MVASRFSLALINWSFWVNSAWVASACLRSVMSRTITSTSVSLMGTTRDSS